MKNLLIAANWKSNKTKNEAQTWLGEVSKVSSPESLEIVIFPPFTLLDFVFSFIKERDLPFKVGAQDISPFDSGAYTGEISASQIKEFADYVIIGHSERRGNFSEDNGMVNRKIKQAVSGGLTPIVCISDLSQLEDLESYREIVIAYEPIGSIGTGNPEDPSLVNEIAGQIKREDREVIYGGSVDAGNIRQYLSLENIRGVLIGGQSLDPDNFINILKNAI